MTESIALAPQKAEVRAIMMAVALNMDGRRSNVQQLFNE
jgi:hypothetical protein